MTVRKRRWTTKAGEIKETWMVHIEVTNPDGSKGKPIRRKSPIQTRRGAEAFERQLRQQLVAGTWNTQKKEVPTVEQFSPDFLSEARTHNKASTFEEKEKILERHLIPTFGSHRLDRIGIRDVDRFKAAQLEAELGPKTINNHLTVLQRMLSLALEYELIDRVPPIKRLRVPEPEFDFLDFDEADRIVDGASSEPAWQAFILVALHTGLRRGELLALEWDDVDLRARTIRVRRSRVRGRTGTPKGHRSRIVPLNATALAALKRHRHLRGPLVFCQEDGSHWRGHQVRPPLRRACKKAGLRQVSCHVLRHSFASHLVMRGASMKAVQELLGHTDIKVTMRYAHLGPAQRESAVALLEQSNSTQTAHARR